MESESEKTLEFPVMIRIDTSFSISKFEITNGQYKKFLEERKIDIPLILLDSNYNNEYQPIVDVSWLDAIAYCNWLGSIKGKRYRLPKESEWKKAAGCSNGCTFPWGDQPPDKNLINFGKINNKPLPINRSQIEESKYGIKDMAGNVAEWCYDSHSIFIENKIVCGASWRDNQIKYLMCNENRYYPPKTCKNFIGFRIVQVHDNVMTPSPAT